MELAVRTVNNNHEMIKEYFDKVGAEITKYIIAREFGKKKKKEHYHYYYQLKGATIKPDSLKRGLRRLFQKEYKVKGKNYYVKTIRDVFKYNVYITKDGDYKQEGFTEEELNEYEELNQEIEYDKQLPLYQKLYNRIKKDYIESDKPEEKSQQLNILCNNKRWIIKKILLIYKDWEKLPPARNQMIQFVNYIQLHEIGEDIVIENYGIE